MPQDGAVPYCALLRVWPHSGYGAPLTQLAWLPVDNSNFCASGVSGINGLGGPER